ncbi:MAG: hypothetical protein ACT4PP_14555 [Sporichthyaceae bacterium]
MTARSTPRTRTLGVLCAATLLSGATATLALVPPAQAAAGAAVTVAYSPGPLVIGQQATLTVTFTHANTVPDQNSPQNLSEITITPSCAAVTAGACTSANPGVFALGDEARASGAGCPTGKFTLGAPDPATGAVRATRLAPEVTRRAGSAA